jgi:D-alanine-D-alanine ligase
MKKLRVLVLCHPQLMPPESLDGFTEKEILFWKTEYDVVTTLRANGHEVKALGVQYELQPIRDEVDNWNPDVVFNLLNEFHGETLYSQNVAAFLELLRVPYTGCNPRGLVLAQGKDTSKKLLKYHRIPVPVFEVYPIGRKATRKPRRMKYPMIVKSTTEDGSYGISQASVVDSDETLAARVAFIHERVKTAAIVEEYIDGREIYVSVFGNERLRALPIWEMEFSRLPAGALPIATEQAKHNPEYQARRGVIDGPCNWLEPQVENYIRELAKRICRALELDGYARVDFRLAKDGTPYFIEANPNPEIALGDEFASSALHDGMTYGDLLNRICALGIKRAGEDADAE